MSCFVVFLLFFQLCFGANTNISSQISDLSRNIINEFCINLRVGGDKCKDVTESGEYIYGFQDYMNSLAGHFSFTLTHAKEYTDKIYQSINDEINKRKLIIENIENKVKITIVLPKII